MFKKPWQWAVAAAVMAAAGCGAMGQSVPQIAGATAVNGDLDPGEYLSNVYKDELQGFQLAPPVSARVVSRPGEDLMTFVVDAKSWGGELQRVTVDKAFSLEEYVQSSTASLNKSFRAVQVLENKLLQFQGHKAARLSLSMEAPVGGTKGSPARPAVATMALYRQELIVQMQANQFLILRFYTPLQDREQASRTFEAMAGSFEVFDPTKLKDRRTASILLGKKWLDALTAESLKPKLSNQPQIFRMLVGGAKGVDVGYLQFTEQETTSVGYKGIEVVMSSRSFPTDGSVLNVKGQNRAFWAYSRAVNGSAVPHYSMWDNVSKTLANVTMKSDPTKLIAQEFWIEEVGTLMAEGGTRLTPEEIKELNAKRAEMIRQNPKATPPAEVTDRPDQFHLTVHLSGDPSQRLAQQGLDVPVPADQPSVLPRVLDYTWPRLVELTKPSEMSFWVFNSSTRKLALRTLVVTGKKERVVVNGKPVEGWKCVDELDPGSTTMWVDNTGALLTVRTSDQSVLMPTTEIEMAQRWAARIKSQ